MKNIQSILDEQRLHLAATSETLLQEMNVIKHTNKQINTCKYSDLILVNVVLFVCDSNNFFYIDVSHCCVAVTTTTFYTQFVEENNE